MSEVERTDAIAGDILHVYDGIEEADNRLPNWWLWSFYLAVIFGGGYWLWFQSCNIGKGPMEQYTVDRLAALDTGEPVTDDQLVALLKDKDSLKAGQKFYSQNCSKCHGTRGEGKEGPNLTDEFWKQGGAPATIFETVYKGRAGKGMPEWGPVFGRIGTMQVVAHVLTLRNTNVPGRAPEGEKWTPPPPKPAGEGDEPAPKDGAEPAPKDGAKPAPEDGAQPSDGAKPATGAAPAPPSPAGAATP